MKLFCVFALLLSFEGLFVSSVPLSEDRNFRSYRSFQRRSPTLIRMPKIQPHSVAVVEGRATPSSIRFPGMGPRTSNGTQLQQRPSIQTPGTAPILFGTVQQSLPRTPQNAQLVCDINQERVLFQGSCYAILKQGPCAAGFVVAYRQDTNTVDCVKDVCGMGKVLWTDGKCYPEINQDHLCTGNLKLFKNKYNLGECGCAPGTVLWEPLNQCFPVFRRGPCEQGEILILNNSPEFEENQLVCEVNPCPSEDYLLLNGRCYERSDHSGCTNGGFLDINYETLQPDCVDVLTKTAGRYSRLRCPSGYRRDFNDICRRPFAGARSTSCPAGHKITTRGHCIPWG